MTGTAAYLHRIGLDEALLPTLASLRLIHRHHLAHVPYENLAIMLGRPPSVDPQACLARVVEHVGLGDAFLEPLPVVEGERVQSGFRFTVRDVTHDGWSFRHDGSGSFTGIEVSTLSTDPAAVLASHAELSSPPDGHFAQLLVVQRRGETGVDVVRGCVRSRVEATGTTQTPLETYDAWRRALTDDLGLALDDVDQDDLQALWERCLVSHRVWVEAGRP